MKNDLTKRLKEAIDNKYDEYQEAVNGCWWKKALVRGYSYLTLAQAYNTITETQTYSLKRMEKVRKELKESARMFGLPEEEF